MAVSGNSNGSTRPMEFSVRKLPAVFRIRRLDRGDWEIRVLSSTARTWAAQAAGREFVNELGNAIRTDLAGVNFFIYRAREWGYRAEYIGPREVIYL